MTHAVKTAIPDCDPPPARPLRPSRMQATEMRPGSIVRAHSARGTLGRAVMVEPGSFYREPIL